MQTVSCCFAKAPQAFWGMLGETVATDYKAVHGLISPFHSPCLLLAFGLYLSLSTG